DNRQRPTGVKPRAHNVRTSGNPDAPSPRQRAFVDGPTSPRPPSANAGRTRRLSTMFATLLAVSVERCPSCGRTWDGLLCFACGHERGKPGAHPQPAVAASSPTPAPTFAPSTLPAPVAAPFPVAATPITAPIAAPIATPIVAPSGGPIAAPFP